MGEKKRQKTMRKFDYSILKDRTWDNGILSYVSQIQEYKGKQELFTRQKPRELKRLIEIARIQNTESSNRIEGIVTTNPRLKQLMDDKTTPRNRDEEEILGYRNVLALVHEDYNAIPVRPNYILQMHRDFLRFTNLSYGGSFKTAANEIDMVLGIGQYISIEKAIADTKESYYKALADAVKLWHEEKNDPKPFIKYMLGVILACYREFEARVTIAEKKWGQKHIL